MKKYVFGVDIGGTTVKIGLFETNGYLLEDWEIKTRVESSGKYILPDIAESIQKRCEEKTIAMNDIEGIGVGVPGPVTEDGTVLKCVNLGWDIINVEKIMNQLMNLKVRVANDAALGEMWQGGGKGYQNLVMVTLGTGVGGGIILKEHILPGSNGAAGEIGHIPVMDNESECCGCGKKGCLEQYTSANGIVHVAKRYLEKNKEKETVLRNINNLTSKDIFDAARDHDEIAMYIVAYVCNLLGKTLAGIATVTNPEAFVIGGGMSKAGDILIENIQTAFKKHAFHALRGADFKKALLGNQAGIYGGAKLIIE